MLDGLLASCIYIDTVAWKVIYLIDVTFALPILSGRGAYYIWTIQLLLSCTYFGSNLILEGN